MAYTTGSIQGIKAYAKTTANGKYYFGGTFETKKNRVANDFLGTLKGELDADGVLVLGIDDADFGTLYYLATKVYCIDGFGNQLEINATGEWDVVGVVDVTTDNADNATGYDNGWGTSSGGTVSTSSSNKSTSIGSILDGVSNVLKGAGDLIKGGNNTNGAFGSDTPTDTPQKSNIVTYVVVALVLIILGVLAYLFFPKKKNVPVPVGIEQPLAGINKPKKLT